MPDYGRIEYWNDRYAREDASPFDWLFDYKELETMLHRLLPDKEELILLIGAGNAPFSPDLYAGGYKNIINTDISHIAIEQQRAKFPEMQWLLMDVMHMEFADNSIPVLIDKSLIDTVLCYSDSVKQTENMIREIYRVMAPGSRYITFSLHSPEENLRYLRNPELYPQWAVSAYRIKSSRWSEDDSRRRAAVAYTMVIADRCNADGSFGPHAQHPLPMPEALSEEEFQALTRRADDFNFKCAMNATSVEQLTVLLDRVLAGEEVAPADEEEHCVRPAKPAPRDDTERVEVLQS